MVLYKGECKRMKALATNLQGLSAARICENDLAKYVRIGRRMLDVLL
ncbi:hypothetical protein [uncultured phage]|nr:hypothetical protein [uncultured phage]